MTDDPATHPAPLRFRHPCHFGAELQPEGGARFRLWAPDAPQVQLLLAESVLPMQRDADGTHTAMVPQARAGMTYAFQVDDAGPVPDPASRAQVGDVEGPSRIVDPLAYAWRTGTWTGRPWSQAIICEVHVGACGGFDGLREQLPRLAAAGYTAIELMPLAEFPGERNWGYDGVLPYAPESSYGTPEQLKALVDTAHELGLMLLLDVVYNHFGPRGNALPRYAGAFFDRSRPTPWGAAIDFTQPAVRRFYIDNALLWLDEYRFDGLRLDAVHAIAPESFLSELATAVRATCGVRRHVHLVLENEHNAAHLLPRPFDAQWNDDGHNALHVLLTGERHSYYADFAQRTTAQLATVLAEGFAFQGQPDRHGRPRGEPSAQLPPTAFVLFAQNHDQIGNRPLGERLSALISPTAMRAVTALVALTPMVPLFFMGEEWGCRTPFLFFTDYEGDLARKVRAGRREEFKDFEWGNRRTPHLPDPNAVSSFDKSRPRVESASAAQRWSAWFTQLLHTRRDELVPSLDGARAIDCQVLGTAAVLARWRLGDGRIWELAANLGPAPARVPPCDAHARAVYAVPPRAGRARCAEELPAFSVVVRVSAAAPA